MMAEGEFKRPSSYVFGTGFISVTEIDIPG